MMESIGGRHGDSIQSATIYVTATVLTQILFE
jgi:hypothetical protein